MTKEEILEKSRKENDIQDERSKYFELKGADFAIGVMWVLWFIIHRFWNLDASAASALRLLVTTTSFSNYLYQFFYTRSKTSLVFSVCFALLAVLSLYLCFR